MTKITVYGSSDDLIEIEGDIREEFNPPYDADEGSLLAFSDGTVLRITYENSGVWRIVPVYVDSRSTELKIDQAPEDDEDFYSDRATLDGEIAWVVHGNAMAMKS